MLREHRLQKIVVKNWLFSTHISFPVAVVSLLGMVGVSLWWLIFNQDRLQETESRYYRNIEQARADGYLETGWLPPFLPPSASNIYEKHNFDYNRVIVSFAFASTDFPKILEGGREVAPDRFAQISPAWVSRKEGWLPQNLVNGDMEALVRAGFSIHEIGWENSERIVGGKILKWFIAIHPERKIAYVWS